MSALRRLTGLALALILCAPPCGAWAEPAERAPAVPMLWRIERTPPSYVLGTIHVPDPRVLHLPAAVSKAFDRADVVYTEIALDLDARQKLLELAAAQMPRPLEELLPEALDRRLERYLAAHGVAFESVSQQPPWMVSFVLVMLGARSAGPASLNPPLDLYLHQRAVLEGKAVGALELPATSMTAFAELPLEEQISMLDAVLAQQERAEPEKGSRSNPVEPFLRAYLRGDETELVRLSQLESLESDPDGAHFLDLLVNQRNAGMAHAILSALQASPGKSHFFAMGTLHLPGPKGVIAQLEAAGLRISRVGSGSGS